MRAAEDSQPAGPSVEHYAMESATEEDYESGWVFYKC